MTNKALWQRLKHLVECDKKITSLATDVASRKEDIALLLKQRVLLDGTLLDLKNNVTSCKKHADLLQLQATELKALEDHKQGLLDNVHGQKEYKALERELSILTLKRTKIDDELVSSWFAVEAAQKSYNEALEAQDSRIAALDTSIINQQHAIDADLKTIEELKAERLEAAALIPKEWMHRYDQMRNRVEDPIVPAGESSCTACFYTILRQDLTRLKTQGILPCRNCYRFMYYDAETINKDQVATF
jgi:predicted  nucleic acid-binding Zn-ribbon protein